MTTPSTERKARPRRGAPMAPEAGCGAKKRREKAVAAPVAPPPPDPRQTGLSFEQSPLPDFTPGKRELAAMIVGKGVARLALAKVEWRLDLAVAPSRVPLSLRSALEVGCTAVPEAPSGRVTKDANGPTVEYGIHTPDLHEYFVSKATGMTGVVHLKRKEDGSWGASVQKTHVPYVLTKEAVEARVMPPQGMSGLPSSLESVVPERFQYWKQVGPQAESTRNALVESGFFPEQLIKVVDGDFRLCVQRLYLYDPSSEAPVGKALEPAKPRTLLDVLRGEVIPPEVLAKGVLTPLAPGVNTGEVVTASTGELLLFSGESFDRVQQVVGHIAKGALEGKPWVVEFDDTPEARAALQTIGRVFKIDASDARDRVFVSSFDPTMPEHVAYIPTERAAATPVVEEPAGVFIQTAAGEQRDIMKRDVRIAKADERYVLGIVLEPETIDAQSDIYSADAIRETAYKFMEQYRTIGLMHKGAINDKVRILESFLAPVDMEVGGQAVKAGTWLMGVRVLDDALWKSCKGGDLTGFSIGGSAIRKPDAQATAAT